MGQGNPVFKYFAKGTSKRDSNFTAAPTFYLPYETSVGPRTFSGQVDRLLSMVFGYGRTPDRKPGFDYTSGLNEMADLYEDDNIRFIARDLGDRMIFGFAPIRDAAESSTRINDMMHEAGLVGLFSATYEDLYEKAWDAELSRFNDLVNYHMRKIAISFTQVCHIGYPVGGYSGGIISEAQAMDDKFDYAKLSEE